MKGTFKFKHFLSYLSSVDPFANPKITLEQYCTPVDITAGLFEILNEEGALAGKVVGDFCCGTAMYSVAASYFEPQQVVAFDIDEDALEIAKANIEGYELQDEVELH